MKHSFTPQKITTDYYPDPVLNEIIAKYAEKFEEASFLIPIGGIKCINTLKALTKDDLILITGDKGYIDQDIFEGREEPFIEADDYAALMVNFDALSKYFLKNKGFSMHMPEKSASFQIMLACFGDKGRYPKLSNAYNEYVAGFGPNDFFNLEDSLFKSNKNPPMTLILSLLRISHWDPHIFYKLKEQIADQIADLDDDYIKDILFELPKVWENFFHLEEEDIPFELGRIFYSVDRLKEAIYYYERSIHFFGREEATLYNLALCLQESGNTEKALEYFEEVYYMDNDFEDVRKWLKHLKTKSFESTS